MELLKSLEKGSEIILQTKIGWNTHYILFVVSHITPHFVVVNGEKYSIQSGKQIGTSTPDYIHHPAEIELKTQLTYQELYEQQKGQVHG